MRTAPKAADLISVDAGHAEEEGSENDGKLGQHGVGFVTEQDIDCNASTSVDSSRIDPDSNG
jgi:hypothetical protein